MAPSTRSSRALYDHFDPGFLPDFFEEKEEEEDAYTDVQMTIEVTEEQDDDDMDDEDDNVIEHDVMEHDPISNIENSRIIIAIDFGTTFSSVAYVALRKGASPSNVNPKTIQCIGNYPGYDVPAGYLDIRNDVPTELWYEFEDIQLPPLDIPDHEHDDDSSSSSDSEVTDEGFDDDNGQRMSAAMQTTTQRNTSVRQFWGFNVQKHIDMMNIPRDVARPLTRFKLNLDKTDRTEDVRKDNDPILANLRERNIINDDTDVYSDFLTHLLRHTKDQLHKELETDLRTKLDGAMVFQFVLCVPAKWPVQACRTMQNALEQAVQRSGFSAKAQEAVRNLFMISEPEAAAECVLVEERTGLCPGETLVIIDAGGGTIDAVTYKCTNGQPLRLSEEVVPPDSEMFGASFINKALEEKLMHDLRRETYLVGNGKTIKSIVQKCSTAFENNEKRKIDVNGPITNPLILAIDNLRARQGKKFNQNRLYLKTKTVKGLYQPSLDTVEAVLASQLERARCAGETVQNIILTGGFGQSPSLKSHLNKFLEGRKNIKGRPMKMIVPPFPSTTVARGAVLRALNKRLGPSRVSQCSYGFLMSEPFQPEVYEEHLSYKGRINRADGERYVDETIHWVIQRGDRVENMQEFAFDVKHTFHIDTVRFEAAEQLWMSDENHPPHHRRTNRQNKGAKKIGTIVADLTELKDEGLVKAASPSKFSTHSRYHKKKHWVIHYEIVMIVEGRSVRFEARWPAKEHRKPGQKHERILASQLVGIASAFQPGTA